MDISQGNASITRPRARSTSRSANAFMSSSMGSDISESSDRLDVSFAVTREDIQ